MNFDDITDYDIKRLYSNPARLEHVSMSYRYNETTQQHIIKVYGFFDVIGNVTVRAYKKIENSRKFWTQTQESMKLNGFEINRTVRK